MPSKVGVVGVVELNAKLDNIANADLEKALKECAVKVQDAAKSKVPNRTGDLEKSITFNFEDKYTVAVGTNKYYAPYVEIGTGIYAGEGTNGMYNQYQGTGRQTPWVYYDAYLDQWFTTVGQKAQPYLLPALLENENWIKERLGAEIKQEVEK